ncbi:hypothetical protein J2X72_004977 [Phyllobacterium sp. 1468]|nr:hypothetical protein [Phyllobacterium sp. 1468]
MWEFPNGLKVIQIKRPVGVDSLRIDKYYHAKFRIKGDDDEMFINSGAPALTLHRWHASVTSTSAPYGFFNFNETERAWWLTGRIVFHRLQEIFADMTELLDKRFPISQHAILWLVAVFWFFFRVKVVEIAEKFIEAVHGWPVLVPITLMVLAKLSSCISLALKYGRHGDIGFLPALWGARQSNLGHACADWNIASNERSPTCSTTLLGVRECKSFLH